VKSHVVKESATGNGTAAIRLNLGLN